jgi:flagellar hook-basal body complex protein FliE
VIPAISGAIGQLGPSEWSVGSVGSLAQNQVNASNAATELSTGQLNDPTQAITAVENASLTMDLASQIRTKLADDINTIFQTQV